MFKLQKKILNTQASDEWKKKKKRRKKQEEGNHLNTSILNYRCHQKPTYYQRLKTQCFQTRINEVTSIMSHIFKRKTIESMKHDQKDYQHNSKPKSRSNPRTYKLNLRIQLPSTPSTIQHHNHVQNCT